jgi:amino-acid N-acetyltransferase
MDYYAMTADPDYRNRSLATILLNQLLLRTAELNLTALYLITTTAEKYYAKKGFVVISRERVPSSIASREFRSLCRSTATVMMKEL